jgi:hypothetical protein
MLYGGAVVSVERPGWISPGATIVVEDQNKETMWGVARVGRRAVARLMWTRDGRLLYEKGLDAEGRGHGIELERHESGGVAWCAQWAHGKQHGLAMQLDARGRPLLVTTFVRGRGTDIWIDCGAVSEVREMADGTLHGSVVWGNPRRPSSEEQFWRGKRHGVFREWDDGKLRRGVPQFYVRDARVSRRAYVTAQARDASLPVYDERDDANARPLPAVVRDALARAKELRRASALLDEVRRLGAVRRDDAEERPDRSP